MNWQNVQLIWLREMRDQLRDRRTLFMVAVLPILMYPLLGTSFFQLAQFMRQTVGRVVVIGGEELVTAEGLPALVVGDRFNEELFFGGDKPDLLEVTAVEADPDDRLGQAHKVISGGDADVVLCFPEGFGDSLTDLRSGLEESRSGEQRGPPAVRAPGPIVLSNLAREPSQVARMRVDRVLNNWKERVVRRNLSASQVPVEAIQPFGVDHVDIAPPERREALLWSKVLPFIVFIWALTGAFYPAIDLCAGEKERGTLETLLSSPARRSEIVVGKMLTVMVFSLFTACLNLASLALTAKVLIGQLSGMAVAVQPGLAPPPLSAMVWVLVALPPVAALFSALSLACATYARSMKEGQYYFMPLFMGAMPLMLAPMSPGVELNLGNSLVPIMGLVLLLRALIEGQGLSVIAYAITVVAVTGVCCWLAMRWAVSQFMQESVLFRESERFDLRSWLASLFRHRDDTPTAAAAMACVGAIFLAQFFSRLVIPYFQPEAPGFGYLAAVMIVGQVVCIAGPALFVAFCLTTSWRKTLLVDRSVRWQAVALGAALAVALRPVGDRLALWIRELYPLSEEMLGQLEGLGALAGADPPIWGVLALFALLPAVCEEVAFRGVILSGLRKSLGDAGAVLVTAVLFGATHTVLQQSLAAAPVGVVIGLVAIRTGSLSTCVVFHAVYNALPLLLAIYSAPIGAFSRAWGLDGIVFSEIAPEQLGYTPLIAILGAVVALVLLRVMGSRSREISRQSPGLEAASL